MKKLIYVMFFLGLSTMGLVSCTPTQVGTATGAAAGAGIGYAVSGDAGGALIGAGAGGLLGYAIGREEERRRCWWSYGRYYCY
ncbi:Uncharacterised protein [Legionella lansingensis]|uniref:Glycine zipper domain-containing protein n=1 Tax=Legionella lansingensis TaxID=45067 RepID=A0A0W0VTW6_9GAMM|nr:glycine zipper domain-containing protein [Legionella lansingensis]KTD23611.1 hypothetical protein Llan_0746 [Legionella lansingensis]SNV52407.1 Uncharacterised protein [Legionella lansingensis]